MKNMNRNWMVLGLMSLLIMQCETPGDPDFTLTTRVDAPLIAENSFQFLGDKGAIIDTTSENLQNLFTSDDDSFISLIKDETFTFDELDDLIPILNVDPAALSTEIGEIVITDFSSQDENGNLGQAGFNDLTGAAGSPSQGDPIPGGQTPFPVNISIDTDYFESASIKQGAVEITLLNDLGLDLDRLSLTLYSDNTPVGSVDFIGFNHNSLQTEQLVIVANPGVDPEVFLTNLNADIEIEWPSQNMQDDAGNLIVNDVSGSGLIASQVSAQIPSQDFTFSGNVQFDDQEFRFETASHYAEIESGNLNIENILNSIDLEVSVLQISFPDIRQGPQFNEADSLVILFDGAEAIPAGNSQPVSRSADLSGYRIFAENNTVNYTLFAETENTLNSESSVRTITETDAVEADIVIENLVISEVFGVPALQRSLLNDNDPDNGDNLDLLNDNEAEIIDIDGIRKISEKVSGIEFTDASLELNYRSNIGLPVSITGAFLGEDAQGNHFFLSGTGVNSVTENEPANLLLLDGSSIPIEDLIRLDLSPSGNPDTPESFILDSSNSTIIDFFNRLPVSIRFIGVADLNSSEDEGIVRNPVQFQPDLRLNVPLSIRADAATYSDTTSQDLGNLPGPGDDSIIEDGSLEIQYSNGIPLGFSLVIEFLDENGDQITSIPIGSSSEIRFHPAPVDGNGAGNGSSNGTNTIAFTRDQLDRLNLTRRVRIQAEIQTTDGNEVRIRETDEVTLRIGGRFNILNSIN
jgi:hypothetical protein